MWFERFVIIIQSLAHEFNPSQWDYYTPTWVEWAITAGSFAWFFMWFLMFIKFMPSMAIAELKELLPPRLRRQKEELEAAP
jgi:molybdopterin-containing oxidoreductase family membrane subunit